MQASGRLEGHEDLFLGNFLSSKSSASSHSPPLDWSSGSGDGSPPSSLDFDTIGGANTFEVNDFLKQAGQASQSLAHSKWHWGQDTSQFPTGNQGVDFYPPNLYQQQQTRMPSIVDSQAAFHVNYPVSASHYQGMPWANVETDPFHHANPSMSTAVLSGPILSNAQQKRRRVSKAHEEVIPSIRMPAAAPMPSDPFLQNGRSHSGSPPVDYSFVSLPGPDAAALSSVGKTRLGKRRHSDSKDDSGELDDEPSAPSGHNAVEKRYRTKINSSLTTLQALIPALAHLKENEQAAPSTSRRSSAFILSAPQNSNIPAGTKIDGVEAPNKLSKGIIIDKGIEYIRVLKGDRAALETQLRVAESIIDQIPQAKAQYEAILASMTSGQQRTFENVADSRPRQQAAPSSRRTMYSVFAGVGLLGTGGLVSSANGTWSETASNAGGRAWTGATELVKRAVPATLPEQAQDNSSVIGTIAIAAWLFVLVWYIGRFVGSFVYPQTAKGAVLTDREQALITLAAYEKSVANREEEVDHRDIAKARAALVTLSGLPRLGYIGIFTGIAREGLLSYLSSLGWRILYPSQLLGEQEMIERACSLVRLAEIESAYHASLCSRVSRLYTCLRLHNLIRSSHWPSEASSLTPPQLSRARVDATLALALVSVFSSQASIISRRRRFWRTAITEPKRTETAMEPWVQVALGAEYDEACMTAFMPLGLPSPSDSIPLLRISEARCSAALLTTCAGLFAAVMHSVAAEHGPALGVIWPTSTLKDFDNMQTGAYLNNIVKSTVSGSPVHYLAILCRGIWSLGVGNMVNARQAASYLLLDISSKGPSAQLASVQCFCKIMTGVKDEEGEVAIAPVNELDSLALAACRWIEIRKQLAQNGLDAVNEPLHGLTLAARRLMTSSVFSNKALTDAEEPSAADFLAAQQISVRLAEQIGRRAIGLDQREPAPDSE